MATSLKHLEVTNDGPQTATLIFLHGLGDSGEGWLPVAQHLSPRMKHVKFILPHAPELPVTLTGGEKMPAWFDLPSLEVLDSMNDDAAGMERTLAAVDRLIEAEVAAGIPESRIVLGGFSQGGAIATLELLTGRRKLAGYVCLSTWVPLAHKFQAAGGARADAKEYPVFWGHGDADNVVEYKYGKQSVELLEKLGFPLLTSSALFQRPGLRFETYHNMGHQVSQAELANLETWLKAALPPA